MKNLLGRFLCFFRLHDFQLIDVTLGFGPSGGVAKLRCRRCGSTQTRQT